MLQSLMGGLKSICLVSCAAWLTAPVLFILHTGDIPTAMASCGVAAGDFGSVTMGTPITASCPCAWVQNYSAIQWSSGTDEKCGFTAQTQVKISNSMTTPNCGSCGVTWMGYCHSVATGIDSNCVNQPLSIARDNNWYWISDVINCTWSEIEWPKMDLDTWTGCMCSVFPFQLYAYVMSNCD